jgi:hypothetical protein
MAVQESARKVLQLRTDSNEPENNMPSEKTIGDVALKDALVIVVGAWLIIALLFLTLRTHNI